RDRRYRHLPPRRGARGEARVRLQEDPLLHPREHRLRPGEPAGPGAAYLCPVVATAAGRAGGALRRPPGRAGRLPRRRLRPARGGQGGGDGRVGRPAEGGGQRRRRLVRQRRRSRTRAVACTGRQHGRSRPSRQLRAYRLPLRQLPRRHGPERATVEAPARAGGTRPRTGRTLRLPCRLPGLRRPGAGRAGGRGDHAQGAGAARAWRAGGGMSLTLAKLQQLKRQAGASTPQRAASPAAPAATDLDQLRRLLRVRARPLAAPVGGDRSLPGTEIARGLFLVEEFLPAPEVPELLDGTFDRGEPIPTDEVLFFDTETTGLAGGTGTRAFMIGAADWCGGQLRIRQLT